MAILERTLEAYLEEEATRALLRSHLQKQNEEDKKPLPTRETKVVEKLGAIEPELLETRKSKQILPTQQTMAMRVQLFHKLKPIGDFDSFLRREDSGF